MSTEFSIIQATEKHIPVIQNIAFSTWPSTYGEILGKEQLDYMLNLIYSEKALQQQMQEGQQFILVLEGNDVVAFAAYGLYDPGIYKLHKLYALPNQQGKGLGKYMIAYIIADIKNKGASALRLNVNRFNKAKAFYEKLGFSILYEDDIDIGNGYFMNDYIMEKSI